MAYFQVSRSDRQIARDDKEYQTRVMDNINVGGKGVTVRYISQLQETLVNHTSDITPNRHGGSDQMRARVSGTPGVRGCWFT